MLSLLFVISFTFSQASKKVINSFCCFLVLNYCKKGLVQATRLIPKAILKLKKKTRGIFLERQLQK